MAKKIQDGNQIITNVDSNDNLTFSIKDSFIDSTPTVNSTNLVTSGGVKSALDINTTDIAAAVVRIANNETNISNHTSAIQALNESVSTNTTNISTNTSNIAENTADITDNTEDIAKLQTQVGTNTSNIATNTSNITSNKADIGTLNNLTTTDKTSLVNAVNEINAPEKWVSVGSTAPKNGEKVWFNTNNDSIYVDEEEWYSKPKVLWSGKATSVDVDLRGYSFIEVIFCSNDSFYNSLKVPVSGSTFSRTLALCNSYLSDPMESSGTLYLKYGKAILTQSGITIKSNVEVPITNTASQIRWQGATNTLLYITTIIGYK